MGLELLFMSSIIIFIFDWKYITVIVSFLVSRWLIHLPIFSPCLWVTSWLGSIIIVVYSTYHWEGDYKVLFKFVVPLLSKHLEGTHVTYAKFIRGQNNHISFFIFFILLLLSLFIFISLLVEPLLDLHQNKMEKTKTIHQKTSSI